MNTYIISLGGSIINPEIGKINVEYLRTFKDIIDKYVNKGKKFVIFCGGGKTARSYQEGASMLDVTKKDLDWIGIMATRINAELVRSMFGIEEKVICDPTLEINSKENVLVAAGWKPGWSTDYDAVRIAVNLKADMVINMSNIEYVYDKDPNKNDDAKPIKKITWENFRKLVGDEWDPGLNAPFDPIASKIAQEENVKTYVVSSDINNLQNVLDGKEFIGTKIE